MSLTISRDQNFEFPKASIINPEVELIGIINKRGKMMNWIGQDIEMPSGKRETFLMKIALRTAMQKDFDAELDLVKYSMTHRGHKKFISIPTFNGNTILVVIKDDFAHEELVAGIIQTLEYSDQFLGEVFSREETLT